MKDIIKDLKGQKYSSENILLQFIRKRVEHGSNHIIIDELDVESNPSLLEELHSFPLGACFLTVAIRGDTRNLDSNEKVMEGRAMVLKKIMRMSTQVYETVTNYYDRTLFKNSTVQHTVLGCKPERILVSSSEESIIIGLKKALERVSSHPAVVILSPTKVLDTKAVVKIIRAITDKQIIAFTGATPELEALRAFLRNPSGFLVTTPELFTGMEATSVVVLMRDSYQGTEVLNGLVRATTSLIFVYHL